MLPDHVIIKESKRARRLALRLDPKTRLFHLVKPRGVSMSLAQAFAEDHESWMQERLSTLPLPVRFEDGISIPVFGKERLIDVYFDEELKRTDITLSDKYIEVRTNKDDPSGRIVQFLKKTVKETLSDLSQTKAAEIGKSVQSVSVRDTKSRWGSCSADGNLSYSWRLIFAPYEALDYVVAHEVAHLKYLDHSRAFWDVCESLSENYKDGHAWMKAHASDELMRYG